MASSLDSIRAERLQKLQVLRDRGIDPYPAETHRTHTITDFLSIFDEMLDTQQEIVLAGRIRSLRTHGGSSFTDIFDGTGCVQAYFKKDTLGDLYDLFETVTDASDFIEVTGKAFVTKRGERSLLVEGWRMLAKSLRPVPDAWYGIKDEELRYRNRYLDILLNEEVAGLIRKRSIFWNTIRTYLLEKGFIEVETPVLETKTGGADARPFVTHHHALDIDVYLRISVGELWQKRLLVAGLPGVFEIGRVFRNEGMSREHLQDYTAMEFYVAYLDYSQGMNMVKDMYRLIAEKTFGTTVFTVSNGVVDLSVNWDIYDFPALLREHYSLDPLDTTVEEVQKALDTHNLEYDPNTINVERGVDLLWKKIRKTMIGPGFLINVPVYMEPLAKRSSKDNRVVERFQIILGGSEMGKGFSELNDPVDQQERFAHQQELRDAGDEEAQMADEDFVEALEYGMPPAFGFGVSERLFSVFANVDVREGQIFPLMRPK